MQGRKKVRPIIHSTVDVNALLIKLGINLPTEEEAVREINKKYNHNKKLLTEKDELKPYAATYLPKFKEEREKLIFDAAQILAVLKDLVVRYRRKFITSSEALDDLKGFEKLYIELQQDHIVHCLFPSITLEKAHKAIKYGIAQDQSKHALFHNKQAPVISNPKSNKAISPITESPINAQRPSLSSALSLTSQVVSRDLTQSKPITVIPAEKHTNALGWGLTLATAGFYATAIATMVLTGGVAPIFIALACTVGWLAFDAYATYKLKSISSNGSNTHAKTKPKHPAENITDTHSEASTAESASDASSVSESGSVASSVKEAEGLTPKANKAKKCVTFAKYHQVLKFHKNQNTIEVRRKVAADLYRHPKIFSSKPKVETPAPHRTLEVR